MEKLKVLRKHSAGIVKIHDRKKDEDGKEIEVTHILHPHDYLQELEVHDKDFVMSKHAAIFTAPREVENVELGKSSEKSEE